MTSEVTTQFNTEFKTFKYPGPHGEGGRDRGEQRGVSFPMITNDICVSTVQVFHKKGGGVTLHYHRNEDGYWLILGGRAKFYNVAGDVVAELGKFEGIFVPRFTRYWFESASDDEPLEILRVSHHSEAKDDHHEFAAPSGEKDD